MSEQLLREFEEWLNERRAMNVSEVFHDIVAKHKSALAQPAEGGEVAKLYCETCTGTGKVFQEVQHGCWVGGEFECPDCDGNGYINSKVWRTTPPASQEQAPEDGREVVREAWTSAANWLRNNYQDHPNIASLCDAMKEFCAKGPQ